jgi:Zn-finger nucleic acid-binding protein
MSELKKVFFTIEPRQTVCVALWTDHGDWSASLAELEAIIAQVRAATPEEYHDKITFHVEGDGDGVESRFAIIRPETDGELEKRILDRRAHEDARNANERRQYERLKLKYGHLE